MAPVDLWPFQLYGFTAALCSGLEVTPLVAHWVQLFSLSDLSVKLKTVVRVPYPSRRGQLGRCLLLLGRAN